MCGKAIFEGIVTGVCMAHERHLHGSRATLVRLASDTCTARERHLYGSRATLVRLASDTCTAHEQHLHGSTGYFYVCKPLKFSIEKNSI